MRRLPVPLFLIVLVSGCSVNEPMNNVSRELASPDGKKKAVMFCRDAGATTGFSTQLSILGVEEKLTNASGNALIVDGGSAQIAWKPDGGLLVTLDQGCRVFKKEAQVKGVAIEYR